MKRAPLFLVPLLLSCSSAAPAPTPAKLLDVPAEPQTPALWLVESFPAETNLDHPDIPNAADEWLRAMTGAKESLDLAFFYITNAPGKKLEPVLQAIEAAASRGVKVRLLVDRKFYDRYPESVDRLAKAQGIEVRKLDLRAQDGVLHAKYFVVDGREVFLGSQNMDWRALEHIHEMGAICRVPAVVEALSRVFRMDWATAGGETRSETSPMPALPVQIKLEGEDVTLLPAASPKQSLPEGVPWDLPEILRRIDGAKKTIDVQVMSYKTVLRNGKEFKELDDALKRAASRGVRVNLLVADWSKRAASLDALKSIGQTPGITVKFLVVPQNSSGFIPFARVAHAKYMVVDGEEAWIGTSNWEGDYFTISRNVSLFVSGRGFAQKLDRVFQDAFGGPYAEPLDPSRTYEAPRIE